MSGSDSGDARARNADRDGSVGSPQREDRADGEHQGICSKWNAEVGYGFIARDGGKDIFVHKSGLGPLDDLAVGDEVVFTVGEGRKGPTAIVKERLRRGAEGREPAPGKRGEDAYEKTRGYIVDWNEERRFGMIETTNGTTVLLPAKELGGARFDIGDRVLFGVRDGRDGRPKAVNVIVISEGTRGKGKGGGRKGEKGKGARRRRRHRYVTSSSSVSPDDRRRPRKAARKDRGEEEVVVKKEPGAKDTSDIDAAADAGAALALLLTAFRGRARADAK
eukprot:gene12364-biopygen20403